MERDSYRDAYIAELEQRVQLLERELRRNFFLQSVSGSTEGSEGWDLASEKCSLAIQYHGKGFTRPFTLKVRDDAANLWKTPAVKFLDSQERGLEGIGAGIIAQRKEDGVVLLRHSKDRPLCIEQGGYWLKLYAGGDK